MAYPGAVLGGRYVLDEQIGIGGYGEVWRATDTVLSRPVALKLLHQRHAEQAETVARFRSEAQHAAARKHSTPRRYPMRTSRRSTTTARRPTASLPTW